MQRYVGAGVGKNAGRSLCCPDSKVLIFSRRPFKPGAGLVMAAAEASIKRGSENQVDRKDFPAVQR